MASKNDSRASVQLCTQVPRFSIRDGYYTAYMDVPQNGCRLALSGNNNITGDTFVDLFTIQDDPGVQDLSLFITSQPYFSKEFTKIEGSSSWRRCVCLLVDDSVFVTCCDNTIESYDTKHGRLVNQRQFTGKARCMTTTRDGRIYIGLYVSHDVIVFDRRLNQINEIKLEGLGGVDYPWDMTVNNNKLFITTGLYGRALMYNINGGYIEYEFKAPNKQYRLATSITDSEENGLIYILWRDSWGRCVVVYSLPGGHSSLPGGHSSLPGGHSSISGCHFLASFNVSDNSFITRVNNNVNRLFVVTWETGEVYEYDTNDIINLENLLTLIELLITKDDCQKLLKYFRVPAQAAETIQKNKEPSKTLLQHLRETGKISAVDISLLLTACNDKGISQVSEAWTNHQKYLSHPKTLQLKQFKDQRKHLIFKLTEPENDRQKLNDRLKETQLEKEELSKRLAAEEEQREQVNEKLRESEDERVQLRSKLEQADDERRDLKDKLDRAEEDQKQLTERLKVTQEEREQLYARLAVAEQKFTNERQLLAGKLEITEEKMRQLEERLETKVKEEQQLTGKLETTEEEKRQLGERLEAKVKEEQQLTTTLEMTEKEKTELTSKLKESDDENQQLASRLETTEEEKRQLGEMLEAKVKEEQQLTTTLEMTEKEKKELTCKLKESDDKRQQLTEEKRQLGERLKIIEEEREQLNTKLTATDKTTEKEKNLLVTRLTASENERQQLRNRLLTTEKKLQDYYDEEKRLKRIVEGNQKELEETKFNLRVAKDDLVQAHVKYAKESMALQEVLQQTREALSKQAITSRDSVEKVGTLPKETETADDSQELTVLAADFGRLMVDVAEDLTLDNTLRLALLFQLPNSEKDMLRRISLIETPGITLVNFLKARNVINMYDVTNLQKGLMRLHLYSTNAKYVVPYQEKIDPFQFEENRSPDLADWPDEKTESPKESTTSDSQGSERAEELAESQNHPSEESLTERIGDEETPRPRRDSQNVQIREPYIEHKINDEGGTIALKGVILSIPEEAVSGDHVIAVTVIRDPDVLLPGTPQRGRMTPLIKLEPDGLKLNQRARLIIPHSAIIPEPDRHSVIIFTGQLTQEESQKGHITWTEERSVEWKLEQEIISLYINTLSYVFVNLVSHEMEQKHMFRVVPFIDGILDAKDDVLITVCFCKDNDAEYQLLLDDYTSKLFLGSYMTFQVSRILNEDSDEVFELDLTLSPQTDSYCLTEIEKTKLVDIDHLCAASRVSLQFRLTRSKDRNGEMIDVKLEVSQGEKNKIFLNLQSKVKNILLSRETQDLLNQELPKDLYQYENLKETVSNLLEKKHCEKIATIFELTPAEREAILNDRKPGMELVKILDERELIMPDKVFGLYQGLIACHLNKIGRHILDYIDATKKEKVNDSKTDQENNTEANEKALRGKDFKLSLNARILTEEGYKRLDVQRALKLSHGKLDLGRRLLLIAKVEHEMLPLPPGSNVHKEQYIDELGCEMTIAGINLIVPAGALNSGRIVKLSISTESGIKGPISNRSLRLVPFVNFGPDNLDLHKQVIMIIPHCAYITSNQTNLDVYSGIPQKDKKIKWNLERKYLSCSMSNNNLQVEIHRPCGLIGPHIPFQQKMKKNICVIPIMKRKSSPTNHFSICLWFYNDFSLEHDCLVHEEVYNNKGIVLHDPVSFQVKTTGSTLPVSISSSTSQWMITPKKVDVDVNSLWVLDRHKVTFHLRSKGNTENVNLEIESRYGVARKILFQINFQFKVDDMHHFEQATSPFKQILPKVTMESFTDLLKKLSDSLDAEQSIQLANIFQLHEDVISSFEKHSKPGDLLMEMLTKKYMISASNVSRLEYSLTEIGNEQCAKVVRDFRRFNPVVHATMSPEDDN